MTAVPRPIVAAIIAAGGRGARLGADLPKQFLDVAGRSLLEWSVERFAVHPGIAEILVALPPAYLEPMAARFAALGWAHVRVVEGGARRQDSVANAFAQARPDAAIIVIHDAARPFVSARLIERSVAAAVEQGAAVAALPVRDTVKQAGGGRASAHRPVAATLAREDIFLAQTPQAFRRDWLAQALDHGRATGLEATDEAMLAEQAGFPVHLIPGEPENIKVTTPDDLALVRTRMQGGAHPSVRVGTGYDLHRLVEGRPLVLGGVTIPFEKGLDGHSDADIVCHAITDAVLGAAAAGDIGRLFPDTEPRWKGADSMALLAAAVSHLQAQGYRVSNVDATVIAQRPRLVPHLDAMRARLAAALQVPVACVSVKGKTNEQVDSMGQGESMACHAVAVVVRQ